MDVDHFADDDVVIAYRAGAPVRVRLLGEDLVAFRDTSGRVALMDAYCPHRRAPMFYGRNEEGGLRCLYHGWKFDVDGKTLDMASEPPGSTLCEKVRHKAYPVREGAGFVWVYMGPAETMPEWEPPVFQPTPETRIAIAKIHIDCNWAQSMEGALDTAHFSFLHMPAPGVQSNVNPNAAADEDRLRWLRNDPMPKFTVREHATGFVIGGARHADNDQFDVLLPDQLLEAFHHAGVRLRWDKLQRRSEHLHLVAHCDADPNRSVVEGKDTH